MFLLVGRRPSRLDRKVHRAQILNASLSWQEKVAASAATSATALEKPCQDARGGFYIDVCLVRMFMRLVILQSIPGQWSGRQEGPRQCVSLWAARGRGGASQAPGSGRGGGNWGPTVSLAPTSARAFDPESIPGQWSGRHERGASHCRGRRAGAGAGSEPRAVVGTAKTETQPSVNTSRADEQRFRATPGIDSRAVVGAAETGPRQCFLAVGGMRALGRSLPEVKPRAVVGAAKELCHSQQARWTVRRCQAPGSGWDGRNGYQKRLISQWAPLSRCARSDPPGSGWGGRKKTSQGRSCAVGLGMVGLEYGCRFGRPKARDSQVSTIK